MPTLRTSIAFARWVATTCKSLIDNYYNVDFDLETGYFNPPDNEIPVLPVEGTIPRDAHETLYWINAAIMFIKTMGRYFHIEMRDMEIELDTIITDVDYGSLDEI